VLLIIIITCLLYCIYKQYTGSYFLILVNVTLKPPTNIKLTVLILVLVVIAIIAFVFNGKYSRKEAVLGFLMPDKGMIKSFASQGGTIEKIWVQDGNKATKGQSLATITVQQNNSRGVDSSIHLTEQLNAQAVLLGDEISQHKTLQTQELLNLQTQKIALENEKLALENLLALAEQKLTLLNQQQLEFNQLNNSYLSKLDKDQQQQKLLEAKQEKQNLARLLFQHNNVISKQPLKLPTYLSNILCASIT
jgi:membrane fusion protein